MKKSIVTIISIIGFTALSSLHGQNCDSLYISSLTSFDEKEYTESIETINTCINVCPDHEKYYLHKAKAYYNIHNIIKTIQSLHKAIDINDTCIEAYTLRAQIYLDQHFLAKAIDDYEKIFTILPQLHTQFTPIYHLNLSKAYNNTRQYHKAYDLLKNVEDKAEGSIGYHANISVSCMYLNKETEAKFHLQKCLEIDPGFTGGLVNMGYYLVTKKEYKKAIEYFDKALVKNPREAYALNNRGFAYFKLHKYAKALDDVNQSIKLQPDNSFAYKNRGLIYSKTGLTEDACKDFEKALKLGYTEMYDKEVEMLHKKICK
ncbi:MAG: tetratricopeptide repeat protein [Bacteroidales bacterium]